MSILLYSNGVIASDSRGVIDQGNAHERLTLMLKLFQCNDHVVMGMIGKNADVNYASKEYIYFSEKVIEMESNRRDVQELKESIIEAYGKEDDNGRTLCFMTRRNFYLITPKGIEATVVGAPWVAGTGGRTAMQSLINGCTVEDSVRNAIQVNPLCGGTVLVFRQKDLKLIPQRRKK